MIFVAGVTGNTGSVVAKTLLQRGVNVRTLVRSEAKAQAWKDRGVEVVVGALDDVATLTKVLRGVEAAYLLTPPNLAAEDFLADRSVFNDALAEAVKQSGVPRVVYLSSVAAHLPEGTGPILAVHDAEAKLRAAGTELIALRAAYFAENWAMAAQAAKEKGVLPSFLTPEAKLTMVSVADIGRVAAELLVDGGPEVVELAGTREYTTADAARAFSAALGKEVSPAYAPTEQIVPTLRDMGIRGLAPLYRDMYVAINADELSFEFPERVRRGEIDLDRAVAQLVG